MNNRQQGFLRHYTAEFSFVSRIFDAAIIWCSLFFVKHVLDIAAVADYEYAGLLAVVFYFFIAEICSVYRSSRLENYGDVFGKIFLAWVIVCALLILLAVLTKTSLNYSRLIIFSWFALAPCLLSLERLCTLLVLRYLRAHSSNTRTYVILGNMSAADKLPQQIQRLPWTGLVSLGHYEDLDTLLVDMQTKTIDYVFVAYSATEQDKLNAAIKALGNSTASIYLIPDVLIADLLGSQWVMLGNTPLIILNDHPFYGGVWTLKKLEDLILGSLILVLISPLMLLIAIAIKLSSPGPILFKQRRHGLNGEVIKVYKFRTMTTLDDGDVVVQATKNDARITPIGKILRRTSLDELPQFFNVLQGSMSIVGPRPHALSHNEHYRTLIDSYMQRHKVRPGITGWAQVNGFRGETDTLEKMQARVDFDLYYINHWSLGFDFKIIMLTILNGFSSKTAY
jgi:putative colanic acid biosynthesis UDP-glucose lipid carrier transferase